MAGGSRAAKRRERKRRLADDGARDGDNGQAARCTLDGQAPDTADGSDEHEVIAGTGAAVDETASMKTAADAKEAVEPGSVVLKDTAVREWTMPVTAANETLVECIALALQQMCALKGCKVPAGKDMMIGRLAPVPRARDGEDASDDAGGGAHAESRWMQRLVSKEKTMDEQRFKILNAKPCKACEEKMQKRGVRRCYYTVSKEFLGVIDLQVAPAARKELTMDVASSPLLCTSLHHVQKSGQDSARTEKKARSK